MAPLPTITPRVSLPLPNIKAAPFEKRNERDLTPSEDGSPEDQPTQAFDGESELSELSDLESDSERNVRDFPKIPQPPGQPGRPCSGGYSIEDALKAWSQEDLVKVTAFTKKLADASLDQSMSYSKQEKSKVNVLCETVARSYPIVGKYEDHWPVRSILKLHLKVKSETFRRVSNQQRGRANK